MCLFLFFWFFFLKKNYKYTKKNHKWLPWQIWIVTIYAHNNKKDSELPNYGKKHMDILQACVMVPRPTPTWALTSACFLSAGGKRQKRRQMKLNWWGRVFYPESSSLPWSLRSAAQSSDRQFFSNRVWGGNSKVHSSYDLMQPKVTEHTNFIFRLGGSVVFLFELHRSYFFIQESLKSLLCLISLLISQWMSFGLRLNHERKLKWSVEVQ